MRGFHGLTTGSIGAASVLLLLVTGRGAEAQARSSERAAVHQRVDGTNIIVEYSRPQARGREDLFGEVVTLERVWTPGANEATTFEFDQDVVLNGIDLAAGKYSVWMVPRAEGDWSLHLHEDFDRFHTQKPDVDDMLLSTEVAPLTGEHTEVLTWDFPEVRRDGVVLRMRWGSALVPLDIAVRPSTRGALTSEEIAPYLGRFSMVWYGDEDQTWEFQIELIDADGKLRGIVDDGEWAFQLLPTHEPNAFFFAGLQDGEVADVEPGRLSFEIREGCAVEFQGLDEDGQRWISGERN